MTHFLTIGTDGGRRTLLLLPGQTFRRRKVAAAEPVKDMCGLLARYPDGTVLASDSLTETRHGHATVISCTAAETLEGEGATLFSDKKKWRKQYLTIRKKAQDPEKGLRTGKLD